MRHVLIVFAVAAVVLVAVAFPQKGTTSTMGSPASAQAIVVANGIDARALAIGPSDSIYVTVKSSDRVFDLGLPASLPLSTSITAPLHLTAGTGTAGSLGDGGAAADAQLSLATTLLYERSGVAIASNGDIYIADTENSTIRRIAGPNSSEPGIIRSIAGRWAPPQNVSLQRPMGIALDRLGNLYVTDRQEGVLDVLHPDTGKLDTIAQISSPADVAVTPDGAIAFVASPSTGSVFAIDLRTHSLGAVEAIAGQESVSAPNPAVPPCSAHSNRVCPSGLAVDGVGNLFIADSTFGRILRIDAHTQAASVVIANLQQPGALAFDRQDRNLYIAEQGLSRIVEAQSVGTPPGALSLSPATWTFANEPLGGTSAQQQFTLTNTSANTVSGVQITSPQTPAAHGDFSLESTSCLPTLAASASCFINVAFTPTTSVAAQFAPLSSTVAVTDANSDSATSSLTGTADDYQIQLANGQPLEVSVFQGNSATFQLQVTSLGAFGQNGEQVSVTCPSGTPAQSVCTVNPSTLSPKPGSPAAFTVKIQTSSTIIQAQADPAILGYPPFSGTEALCCLGFFVFAAIGSFVLFKARFRYAGLAVFLFGVGLALNGCHHASTSATATPAGAAQILIQGSALTQSGAPLNATRGLTVTLDVVKI